jgi:prefoldin subunit 5
MSQVTQVKLKSLNVFELYKHYNALENSLPFLTAESQQLAQSELEICANLRSEKIDRIYYAMASHEDAIERITKEQDLLAKTKLYHTSQLKSLKGLLSWLRRALPSNTNKITGRNYQFTLSKKKDLSVQIELDPEEWTEQERLTFCIEEEVTTTKHTVVRSLSGEVLIDKTDPKTTVKIVPNLDVIRNAYQTGQSLPQGVKVVQEYSVRSQRVVANSKLDLHASEYFGDVLPEVGTTD